MTTGMAFNVIHDLQWLLTHVDTSPHGQIVDIVRTSRRQGWRRSSHQPLQESEDASLVDTL